MTTNRYTTPAEGSLDWHIPLNENFDKLDNHVEVRDAESNLSSYEPKQNAKFLATDTGAVYVGDGSSWNSLGKIQESFDSGGVSSDGSIVAGPGEVQNAIDQAARNGGGTVRLDPTQRYEQDESFPWHVKSRVTLEFNGAILYGSGEHNDTDMIHVYPEARVFNPTIDLWDEYSGYAGGNKYNGNVFTLNSKYGPYFSDGTTIRGGWTRSVQSTGAWIYMGLDNDDKRVDNISLIDIHSNYAEPKRPATTSPPSFDVGIHLDTSGGQSGSYLNSIRFSGHWAGADIGVLQTGDQPSNGHRFNCIFQPNNSTYMWKIADGAFSRQNKFTGYLWDAPKFDSGLAWLIDSTYDKGGNQRTRNNNVTMHNMYPRLVENNSGMPQYVTNPTTYETTKL